MLLFGIQIIANKMPNKLDSCQKVDFWRPKGAKRGAPRRDQGIKQVGALDCDYHIKVGSLLVFIIPFDHVHDPKMCVRDISEA